MENQYLLIFDIHHIIADGMSADILIKQILDVYFGNPTVLPRLQYKDYSSWVNDKLSSVEIRSQEKYWLDLFKQDIPVLNLRTDFPRPSVQSFNGTSCVQVLDKSLTKNLYDFASSNGVTLFMLLFASYFVLLNKYTSQEDIIVGTVFSGRTDVDLQNLVGMFVNTVPIRSYPQKEKTFFQFLNEVSALTLSAMDSQEFPFEKIMEKINFKRDMSRNPLFDTMFVMQNTDNQLISSCDLTVTPYFFNQDVAKFDLTIEFTEFNGDLQLRIEYCTELFKKETIENLAMHYIELLNHIIENPGKQIRDLNILSQVEQNQILHDFNSTDAAFPNDVVLHSVFEKQVELYPTNVAVVIDDTQVTFHELNLRANQLAHLIRSYGIKPDDIVALLFERSIDMIVAILATLKSGAAYLPIDPDYPIERINYMLEDSGSKILVSSSVYFPQDIMFGGTTIFTDEERVYSQSIENLVSINKSTDLAYIIYTSGSTGKPKGVMIEHKNVIRLLINDKDLFDFSNLDVWTMFHSYCFDFSVWEMYGALLYGGKLVIVPKYTTREPRSFLELLDRQKVTILNQTPTAFYNLIKEHKEIPRNYLRVRKVIFGGEALAPIQLKPWYQMYPDTMLINMYGITETTVHVTYKEISNSDMHSNLSNIGKPIPTLKTYIVDENCCLLPKGVPGELVISGEGLARGYLNRPELTDERFINCPFNIGERIYRSGDLARWLPDGNIEYLGRIDHQVKIRGYRIELGEIETLLLKYPKIVDVKVIDKVDETGAKYLCAYYVADAEIKTLDLRNYLNGMLPAYMIPSYFVQLDKLPLTSNGKVDRASLPSPKNILNNTTFVAPRTKIEACMVKIWENVLGQKEIGIEDDFFEIGGDSIKAIQIIAALQKYQLKLTLKDFFGNTKIRNLAPFVSSVQRVSDQNMITGSSQLSPIQHWFFEKKHQNFNHWNQSVMLYNKSGFVEESLIKAISKIVEHHDILRAIFTDQGSELKQITRGIEPNIFEYQCYSFTDPNTYLDDIHAAVQLAHCRNDIEKGPLVQVHLFRTLEGDHLFLCIHHLVVDGVSWRILLDDLNSAYEQALKGNSEIHLQEKTDSYLFYSEYLYKMLEDESLHLNSDYWVSITRTNITKLPKDHITKENKHEQANEVDKSLSKEETEKLLKSTTKILKCEINDLLLTALGLSIYNWTRQTSILLNLEGHGREILFEEGLNISRTVGWFTSIYPVILKVDERLDIVGQLNSIKNSLREIPHKGVTYGMLKYLQHKENEYKIEPEITFNYYGEFDRSYETKYFTRSSIPTGQNFAPINTRNESLEYELIVMDGQLNIKIIYNKLEFEQSTVNHLLNCFVEKLVSFNKVAQDIISGQKQLLLAKENQKKVLQGILPFNELYYRDCFYNALFPILGHFKKSILPILINDFPVYNYSDVQSATRIGIDYYSNKQLEQVLFKMGIIMNPIQWESENDDILSLVTTLLLLDKPVILGVDCYYLTDRSDMYNKNHWSHTILVYGFDSIRKVFNVIEHDKINTLTYKHREISYDALAKAFGGYIKNYYNPNTSPAIYEFSVHSGQTEDFNMSKLIRFYERNVLSSSNYINKGLNRDLPQILSGILKQVGDEEVIKKCINELLFIINGITLAKKAENYLISKLGLSQELITMHNNLVEYWSTVNVVLEKYSVTGKYRSESFKQFPLILEKVQQTEIDFYFLLTENLGTLK
ncbi:MAG: hypothetical protein K0Q87_3148, partial [Neobacillus sp.]|nr:hypothetical protein [Neobacillus sp.]